MNLVLRRIRRGSDDDRYAWTPFDLNDDFNASGGTHRPTFRDDPLYVQVLLDDAEVARVELDEGFEGSKHVGAPKLGSRRLRSSSWKWPSRTGDWASERRSYAASQTFTPVVVCWH